MVTKAPKSLLILDDKPLALGCAGCPDLAVCGGLTIDEGVLSCMDFCNCTDPAKCPHVCPSGDAQRYRDAVLEVGGWELSVPRCPRAAETRLPSHIPLIHSKSSRANPVVVDTAAVQLHELFDNRTGKPRYWSSDEICDSFLIVRGTKLVISGVSTDQPIENFWGKGIDAGCVEAIASIAPSLVTVPNFSLFANVPRTNDLYNMKRQIMTWRRFAEAGVDAALHLNARSSTDYRRLADFLYAHPEIGSVSFEFATGARANDNRRRHIEHLSRVGDKVGGRLRIVVRGGICELGTLARHYRQVAFVDTDCTHRSRARMKCNPEGRQPTETITFKGQDLDELLQENIDARSARVRRQLEPVQRCGGRDE